MKKIGVIILSILLATAMCWIAWGGFVAYMLQKQTTAFLDNLNATYSLEMRYGWTSATAALSNIAIPTDSGPYQSPKAELNATFTNPFHIRGKAAGDHLWDNLPISSDPVVFDILLTRQGFKRASIELTHAKGLPYPIDRFGVVLEAYEPDPNVVLIGPMMVVSGDVSVSAQGVVSQTLADGELEVYILNWEKALVELNRSGVFSPDEYQKLFNLFSLMAKGPLITLPVQFDETGVSIAGFKL